MPDASRYIWLFLHLKGRIGRAVFFLGYLLIGVIQVFPVYKAMVAVMQLDATYLADESFEELMRLSPEFARWWTVTGFLAFVMLWPCIALTAKRFHDIGRSGIFTITLFIPIVQFIAFVALCIIPGQPGPNAYGSVTDRRE